MPEEEQVGLGEAVIAAVAPFVSSTLRVILPSPAVQVPERATADLLASLIVGNVPTVTTGSVVSTRTPLEFAEKFDQLSTLSLARTR